MIVGSVGTFQPPYIDDVGLRICAQPAASQPCTMQLRQPACPVPSQCADGRAFDSLAIIAGASHALRLWGDAGLQP
jgi:hypothetical protein